MSEQRIAELEAENERLREDNQKLLAEMAEYFGRWKGAAMRADRLKRDLDEVDMAYLRAKGTVGRR